MKARPHGIDIGPLEPALPERLANRDKRINLAPALYEADMTRLAERLKEPPEDALLLIGRRDLRSTNSWMHNSHRLRPISSGVGTAHEKDSSQETAFAYTEHRRGNHLRVFAY